MIAVDTNLLVYAHRKDSIFHVKADELLTSLAEGPREWCIPWPCVHEFLAIVTHRGIYKPPTPLEDALVQVECWLESPTLRLLGEGDRASYWPHLRALAVAGRIEGARIHDARIAAICVANGIDELWTSDRDFSRLAGLKTANPLV
jgi:uncharacterized protein